MTDKSYVTLAQNICVACGELFDTGEILMDRRMRDRFEQHTTTGWGLCPPHQKLKDQGMVALVAIDPAKSHGNDAVDVYRTGQIAYVATEIFTQWFDQPAPEKMVGWIAEEIMLQILEQNNVDE